MSKNSKNNKLILICLAVISALFLIYYLALSPYAQCVDGYKKRYGNDKTNTARAKIYCGRQSG